MNKTKGIFCVFFFCLWFIGKRSGWLKEFVPQPSTSRTLLFFLDCRKVGKGENKQLYLRTVLLDIVQESLSGRLAGTKMSDGYS